MKREEILIIIKGEMDIVKCVKDIAMATPNPLVQDRVMQINKIALKNLEYMESLSKTKSH